MCAHDNCSSTESLAANWVVKKVAMVKAAMLEQAMVVVVAMWGAATVVAISDLVGGLEVAEVAWAARAVG